MGYIYVVSTRVADIGAVTIHDVAIRSNIIGDVATIGVVAMDIINIETAKRGVADLVVATTGRVVVDNVCMVEIVAMDADAGTKFYAVNQLTSVKKKTYPGSAAASDCKLSVGLLVQVHRGSMAIAALEKHGES